VQLGRNPRQRAVSGVNTYQGAEINALSKGPIGCGSKKLCPQNHRDFIIFVHLAWVCLKIEGKKPAHPMVYHDFPS